MEEMVENQYFFTFTLPYVYFACYNNNQVRYYQINIESLYMTYDQIRIDRTMS